MSAANFSPALADLMPAKRGYRRQAAVCLAIVLAGVLAYSTFFSWLAIARHDALRTHTADLGQIDLAVWNTAYGRFVQEVKGEAISTRLTDHFEPIFWPVSVLLHLWDDVRALLVAQAALLALAAVPVFAFVVVAGRSSPPTPSPARRGGPEPPRPLGEGVGGEVLVAATWAALAYLLAPQAQAATVTDFHAAPLAAFPLVLLLLLGYRRRTWPALVAALLCLAVKEEIGLAVLVAGLYFAVFRRWRVGWLIAALAAAWFVVATFVVIPHYAHAVYGLSGSPYLARYDGTGTETAAAASLPVRLLSLARATVQRILEPGRLKYLAGLLVAFAGLPLLAPEVAAIALPLIGANYVSGYSAMYGGEFHYSAPFIAILAAAAGLGAVRLFRFLGRRHHLIVPALALMVVCPVAYQAAEGFTPLGREYALQRPVVTEHARLLQRFAAQIPAGASLSTTPPLQPHFSHRRQIYTFPDLAAAEYVLLDVSGTTDMHPNDFRRAYDALLAAGYGAVDSADGYVLLKHSTGGGELSLGFYSFARPTGAPQHAAGIDYGASLRLTGWDWIDDPKWGYTRLRLYWQVLAPLSDDLAPYVRFTDRYGQPLADTASQPFVEPLWYPLSQWQVGETVLTTTVPIALGDAFEAYVAVTAGSDPGEVAARLPVSGGGGEALAIGSLNWARLAPVARLSGWRGASLVSTNDACDAAPPVAERLAKGSATFGGVLELLAAGVPASAAAGEPLAVALRWRRAADLPADVAVSLRLVDTGGTVVAQADGSLHGGAYPPSSWPPATCVGDRQALTPSAAGAYRLAIVVYDRATLQPLPLPDGNTQLLLAPVTVAPR